MQSRANNNVNNLFIMKVSTSLSSCFLINRPFLTATILSNGKRQFGDRKETLGRHILKKRQVKLHKLYPPL